MHSQGPIWVLRDGTSSDGMGRGRVIGYTSSAKVASDHKQKVFADPYRIGGAEEVQPFEGYPDPAVGVLLQALDDLVRHEEKRLRVLEPTSMAHTEITNLVKPVRAALVQFRRDRRDA